MPLHDLYARVTPFELAFANPGRADALAEAVAEEARLRAVDDSDPFTFVTMGAVGAFLRELQGPDAPPEAVHQYGALAFHAVAFTRAGRPLYLLGAHVARYLVEGAPGAPPEPPAASGYLQLPQHMFWMGGDGGLPPESIDGVCWTTGERGLLHAMLAIGVRPDRPGLGVVPIPEAPLTDASMWAAASVRGEGEGEDFTSDLPGADLDRLYALKTAGEALKLLARFFSYARAFPGALERRAAHAHEGVLPAPSALPFTRVGLDG